MNLGELVLVVVSMIYLAAFLVFFITSEIDRKKSQGNHEQVEHELSKGARLTNHRIKL